MVGLGLHKLAGNNLQQLAEHLAEHLHLNPASHFPGVILHVVGEFKDANLAFLAAGALVYGILRFVEAYGLWHNVRWIGWFALFSGAIYLPVEIYELYHYQNLLSLLVLFINVFIVLYMLNLLFAKHA